MASKVPVPKPRCVALVEAYGCLRAGLATILEQSGYRITVSVDEADSLARALAAGSEVDLVILDVRPPVAEEEAPLCTLLTQRPDLPAIAVVQTLEAGIVVWAIKNGAKAVVERSVGPKELLAAVDTVCNAGIFHTEATQRILLECPDGLSPEERRRQKLLAQLPPRSLEVLQLLCRMDDLTYEEIGKELKMGKRTVEDHVAHLRELFGVRSKTALVLGAIRLKIVQL